jgi:hypothetical protein
LGVKVQGSWPLGRLSTEPGLGLGGHPLRRQPDASVGADGPEVEVPHDVAGLLAGEVGEALGQLIDRGGHAREALGAAVGVLHESSIHEIGGPWGFGGQSGHWPLGHRLARLEALEQCHVGVDCGLVAAILAQAIDVKLEHLDEHIAVGDFSHEVDGKL